MSEQQGLLLGILDFRLQMASVKAGSRPQFLWRQKCMVPGPKYSSLQMGNDPRGQRMFLSFIKVTVLKVTGGNVSFYVNNVKLLWKRCVYCFLMQMKINVIGINQTVYISRL